jgi:NADPH-dependent curcumin reductase CurA
LVAALNFRDVKRALGQLKEKDLSVGLEFSGYNKDTKQQMFGVSKNSIGSHGLPVYSFRTPSNLSDVQAAKIPVDYLTAHYALFQKANLRKGQSVLIHTGTSGVGMAAIQLAQSRSLTVFATCSAAKRQH